MASRLAHPSCTIGADLEGKIRGRTAKKAKEATSRKKSPRGGCTNVRTHETTGQSRSNPRSFARSYCFWSIPPFHPQLLREQVPRGGSPEKPRLACPERNQCVAYWSSAAARMQKLAFRHPSHSTASSDIPDTTTCTYCCCQTPRHKQWQSSVNPRVKRWSSFTAVVTVHGFGFF